MSDTLASIEARLGKLERRPPLSAWQPPLSGDIDIIIDASGRWFHEGSEIKRQPLVRLFASILRREADGEYYLVTPVEKWRIGVEDLPLQIVDMNPESVNGQTVWLAQTNTDLEFPVGPQYPLSVELSPEGAPLPRVDLDNGLAARIQRAVYYRLVEAGTEDSGECWLDSSGERYSLGALEA